MNALLSLLTISVSLSALLLSTGPAQATGINDYSKGHGGTLACGGSHFSRTELGPHETTQINTGDILVEDLEPAARPIQSHVKWSDDGVHKGITLNGSTFRTVRAADTGAELSRTSSECNLINYRR